MIRRDLRAERPRRRRVLVEPHARLIDLLRDDLGETGTKEGCGEGECGACTVLVDGAGGELLPLPAPEVDGARVTTIEGLAVGDELSPGAAGLPGERRRPVRLLHARHGDEHRTHCSTRPRPRRRDPRRPDRQPLPLHGLRPDRRLHPPPPGSRREAARHERTDYVGRDVPPPRRCGQAHRKDPLHPRHRPAGHAPREDQVQRARPRAHQVHRHLEGRRPCRACAR